MLHHCRRVHERDAPHQRGQPNDKWGLSAQSTDLIIPFLPQDELRAFTAYAIAFPKNFLALVDTYHTLHSGVPNFVVTSLALHKLGYRSKGV